MTLSILTFAAGDTDYITKHNTNNAAIKDSVDTNEQAIIDAADAALGYDLGSLVNGLLTDGYYMLHYPFPRAVDFVAGFTGSQAVSVYAATASAVFDIKKNGSSIGSITFGAASTTGTFSVASQQSFAIGDVLSVVAPATADATLGTVSLSFRGVKG